MLADPRSDTVSENDLESDGAIDIMARLSALRDHATEVAGRPLRPSPETLIGFIETLAMDGAGLVWLSGWMRRGTVVDLPVVIVDRQKIPAALTFSLFERDDLDAQSCGIIGVIHTDWRPSSLTGVCLYIGDSGRAHLRIAEPPRIMSMQELGGHFADLLPRCHTGHTAALQRLLTRPESWAPTAQNLCFAATAALDRVLVQPRFGAFVSGWALSPVKPIRRMVLRMGSAILPCDPDSIYFSPRPDLAGALPGGDYPLDRAGFAAIFRGRLADADLLNPILKLIYADGSSSNHAVPPQAVRRLGQGVGLESVTHLYPSMTEENFFPEFAAALRLDSATGAGACRPYAVAKATEVLIFAVPDDRSDMFLRLADIEAALQETDNPPGVALLAGPTADRPDLVSLFGAWRATSSAALSLFFVDDTASALYAVPKILSTLGARAFLFAAPGVFLTEAGWRAVLASRATAQTDLAFFHIEDAPSPRHAVSPACLAWNAADFGAWIASTPVVLGGDYHALPFGAAAQRATIHKAAARRARWPATTPLMDAVNQLAAVASC